MEVVVFLAFLLSLKVHAYQQSPSMYYYRYPPDNIGHVVGIYDTTISSPRSPDQQERHPFQWTSISCIE